LIEVIASISCAVNSSGGPGSKGLFFISHARLEGMRGYVVAKARYGQDIRVSAIISAQAIKLSRLLSEYDDSYNRR
jgi:hypothetical protein